MPAMPARSRAANKAADDVRRRRIRRIIDDWGSFLGVTQRWYVVISLMDSISVSDHDPSVTPASITFNLPYVKALLQVTRWGADDLVHLEYYLVHELMHLIIEEHLTGSIRKVASSGTLADIMSDGSEALCDVLARILIRARSKSAEGEVVFEQRR